MDVWTEELKLIKRGLGYMDPRFEAYERWLD
jgi:hypothetical protein